MYRDLALFLLFFAALGNVSTVLAQTTPSEDRIIETIIVNGQSAQGVMVIQNGNILTHSCTSPRPYTTPNQSESGWACFDQTTGMWLLHAVPPQQAAYTYQQPQVYVVAPTIPVYSYSYPYSYYSNGYPYSRFAGPRFSFGFGFGYRSPVIVNRPVIRGPFLGRPFVRGPVIRGPIRPFAPSRPFIQRQPFGRGSQGFGGQRPVVSSRPARGGGGFGRIARR